MSKNKHTRADNDASRTADNLARQARHEADGATGETKIYVETNGDPLRQVPVTMAPTPMFVESKPDAFHSEEKCFTPRNGIPSITALNEYLNTYRADHPNAALLQMIPTATNTYLFVWEL